jgi:hypothetical protein
MRILIVFEDLYGVSDIFRKVINFHDGEVVSGETMYLNENIAFKCGCGNCGCINLSSVHMWDINKFDVVISVFDIDKIGKSDNNMANLDAECKSLLSKSKYSGQRLFMPVIYNSETVMLYQYLHGLNGMDVVDIVHKEDTFKMQLNLLSEIVKKTTGLRSVKRVHEYLDLNKLLIGMNAGRDDANFYLKRWLRNNCSFDLSLFASQEDLLQEIHKTRDNMKEKLTMNVDKYYIDSRYYIDATTAKAMKPILRDM